MAEQTKIEELESRIDKLETEMLGMVLTLEKLSNHINLQMKINHGLSDAIDILRLKINNK